MEGYLTSEVLHMHWLNTVKGYCEGKEKICDKAIDFLAENLRWTRSKVRALRNSDPYWRHVGLFLDQIEGELASCVSLD